jgi:BirA family biotin operon repressor/biotin-[acetyl-CoA-carboxylase] ligase
MSSVSGDLIRHGLSTHVFGQNVVYTIRTGSTNTDLKQAARKDAPEGLLYVTDEQLVGRGRLKRSWYAPPGSSLLTSLLFRPGDFVNPPQTQHLTMMCALAMSDSIEAQTGLRPDLKWPNDIVWRDGKKLGGILTETEIEGQRLSWVAIGLGLNVNIDFSEHRDPTLARGRAQDRPYLAETATSLSMILGRDTDDLRLPILKRYLVNVETRYEALKQGRSPRDEWQNRLVGLGQAITVTVLDNSQIHEGTLTGIDENGALVVRQADGSTATFVAGDVTLR